MAKFFNGLLIQLNQVENQSSFALEEAINSEEDQYAPNL
ncbi:hypothetical protein LDG_8398 [Legionella drancourtii LLAP12]|uniref:Uncharacterized protein n=1 Tax=Legionella drancourtii LLAP12 TaxID=658187 RepID=G9ESX1_9GAMM|nr:hypothetical protein LDG_8398 [Legionella drancourtii LLAP12]